MATANLHLLPKLAAAKAQAKAVTAAAAPELEDGLMSATDTPSQAAAGGVLQLRVLGITPSHCQPLMQCMCVGAASHSSKSGMRQCEDVLGHCCIFLWLANWYG